MVKEETKKAKTGTKKTGLDNKLKTLTVAVASAGLLVGGKAVAQNADQQTDNQQGPQVQQQQEQQEQITGVFRQQIKETGTIIRWSVTDKGNIYRQTERYDENGKYIGVTSYSKYGQGYATTMANPQLNYRNTTTEMRDSLNRKLMVTTTGQLVAISEDKTAYLPDTKTKVKLTAGEKRQLKPYTQTEVASKSITQHNLDGTSVTHDTIDVTGMDGNTYVLVVTQKFETQATNQQTAKHPDQAQSVSNIVKLQTTDINGAVGINQNQGKNALLDDLLKSIPFNGAATAEIEGLGKCSLSKLDGQGINNGMQISVNDGKKLSPVAVFVRGSNGEWQAAQAALLKRDIDYMLDCNSKPGNINAVPSQFRVMSKLSGLAPNSPFLIVGNDGTLTQGYTIKNGFVDTQTKRSYTVFNGKVIVGLTKEEAAAKLQAMDRSN